MNYIRDTLRRDGRSADDVGLPPTSSPHLESYSDAGDQPDTLEALRKVQRGEPIDDREHAHLEAVVIPGGLRPAFDILHDSYEQLPDNWARLNEKRTFMEPFIRGIGRLNLTGRPAMPYAGTAFVVANDLVLTNRHVAEYFVEGVGGAELRFTAGVSAGMDFKQEVGSTDTVTLDVTAPSLILETWDAALLRVGNLPEAVKPLRLASSELDTTDGRLAAVVGYPAMDPASDLVQQLEIFRGVFYKKRLMPGRLIGMKITKSYGRDVSALGHDCTTLGGNSGSTVIDVESELVVGLHFAGDYLVANYSVPTWELAKDPKIAAAQLNFA